MIKRFASWLWKGPSAPHVGTKRRLIREGTTEQFRRDGGGFQGRRIHGAREDNGDMTDTQRATARALSRELYNENELYGAVNDRFIDHVIGDGIVIEVHDNPVAQEWLDEQLSKRENRFHETLHQRFARWIVDGEYPLLITTLARGTSQPVEFMGKTVQSPTPTEDFYLGRLDVEQVSGVGVSPFNHDAIIALEYTDEGAQPFTIPIADEDTPLIPFDADRRPLDPDADDAPPVERLGAAQFWQARTIGRRSGPLFSRIIDRAKTLGDGLEQFLRKWEYMNRWWIWIKGNKSAQSTDWAAFEAEMIDFFQSVESGEAFVTSNDVEIETVAPKLDTQSLKELYDVFLDLILGAYAIPRHWFSSGGDTNRATSAEQGSPIYRFIKSWQQSKAKPAIEDMVAFLLELGRRAGVFAEVPEFTVSMADVATRDSIRDADEMLRVVVALREYVTDDAISPEELQRILRAFLASKWVGDHLDEKAPEITEDEVDIDDPDLAGAQPGTGEDEDKGEESAVEPAAQPAANGAPVGAVR